LSKSSNIPNTEREIPEELKLGFKEQTFSSRERDTPQPVGDDIE
jgi:hypothetical protein